MIDKVFLLNVLLIIISLSIAQWAIDDSGCITPSRTVGDCISIRDCKPIMEVIMLNQPMTPNLVNQLKNYHCGFEIRTIKVCCPRDNIFSNRLIEEETTTMFQSGYQTHKNSKWLPENCGLMAGDNRIYGGNKTALFEMPFMALLSYNLGNGIDFRCAGSIINDHYILTAAHCLTNLGKLKLLGVRVGEHNISSSKDCIRYSQISNEICANPVQDLRIEEVIPHPDYNPVSFVNDIGLIRLRSRINISESAKPICLPLETRFTQLNFTTSKLTVTGWGVTETGRKSDLLLKIIVTALSQEDCSDKYNNTDIKISDKQICAGGLGVDSCAGDSGGPLQRQEVFDQDVKYVQYGVVSFGPRMCGQEGIPGVYTRIDTYMEWILDTIRQ